MRMLDSWIEIHLKILATIIGIIVGKMILRIQSDILLLLGISAILCTIDFIADLNANTEEKTEMTNTVVLQINNVKKGREKFLISEAILWIAIGICDVTSIKFAQEIISLLMVASFYLWVKFIYGVIGKNDQYSISFNENWLYFGAMPTIYLTRFIVWIAKSYEIISQSSRL